MTVTSLTPDSDTEALVFDIQRFSIHDGPGIRTVVFFKGCPLSCAWCQNPESLRVAPEIAFYTDACRRCFACRSVCPAGCIDEGEAVRIDRARCTTCGACVDACVHHALRFVGRRVGVAELVDELLRDRDFYEDSGGGVTLSGGEPLLQAGFLARLLPTLRERGVHVLVETSGLFAEYAVDRVFPLVNQTYVDVKHMDPADHKRWTGRSNRIILSRIAALSRRFGNVQVRMPVIPGINDGEANIRATADFLNVQGLSSIHCLPYHPFGESKRQRLGMASAMPYVNPDPALVRRVAQLFESEGIHAVIYD